MLSDFTGAEKVYICCGYTDLRQGIDGLSALVKDRGISGTTVHKRLDFQRMINDAVEGKIDLILTKSISRFGRNIVDILNNLRLLSSLPNPVAVEFEMEGITYSGDGSNNLVITILSALAEMESPQRNESVEKSGGLPALYRESPPVLHHRSSFRYLYTVGLDTPHTLANSLMFSLPAAYAG